MKKSFKLCMLMIACLMTTNLFATYYVVGNGTDDPNGHWVNGKNWTVDAVENALDANGTITFTKVAGGKNYGFKITDGQWGSGHEFTTIDYDNSDEPMYGGNGSDMGFTLSEDADVTISLVDGKVRLTATKPLAYRSHYIAGNCEAMGKSGDNWSPNSVPLVEDAITLHLTPEWYEFKLTDGSWGKTWGYSEVNVAVSSPMHKTYGDGNNICFRLQAEADVTVKLVRNQVVLLIDREYCITGNGAEAGDGAWLAGHNWYAQDADNTLDANLSRTYFNLPNGTYKFKVKENVSDAWNDDCTWGYDHLDTENSNAGVADGSNIAFTLSEASDVTIALVNNKIVLTVEETTYTALENVSLKNDGKYYDVLGREIATPQKGNLYIHNGKKVIF